MSVYQTFEFWALGSLQSGWAVQRFFILDLRCFHLHA